MNQSELFFGIIGLISFGFSIFSHYQNKAKKEIESAKAAMQSERMRSVRYSLSNTFHIIDSIVQISKLENTTIDQLKHLARVARGNVFTVTKLVTLEQKKLEAWRYGKLFESEDFADDEEGIEDKDV